jgi:hypothetical protein
MPAPYTVFKDNASVPSAQTTLAAAGTAQQLCNALVPSAKVFVTAGRNNAGVITFGGPTVKANQVGTSGDDVVAGGSITIEIDDLSKVWYDGTNTGDTVSFSYLA